MIYKKMYLYISIYFYDFYTVINIKKYIFTFFNAKIHISIFFIITKQGKEIKCNEQKLMMSG